MRLNNQEKAININGQLRDIFNIETSGLDELTIISFMSSFNQAHGAGAALFQGPSEGYISAAIKAELADTFETEFNAEFNLKEKMMPSLIQRDINKTAIKCDPRSLYKGYFSGFKVEGKPLAALELLHEFKDAVSDQNAGFLALEDGERYLYIGVGYAQSFDDEFKKKLTPEI